MATKINYASQYNELKAKHADTILLFHDKDRVYCAFYDDAITVSNIIGSVVMDQSSFKMPELGKNFRITGFVSSELDVNLPKIVRAGHRVAIIDTIDGKPNVIEDGDDIQDVVDLYQQQNGNGEETEHIVIFTHNPATNETDVVYKPVPEGMTADKYLDEIYSDLCFDEKQNGIVDNLTICGNEKHGKTIKYRALGDPDSYVMMFADKFNENNKPFYANERFVVGDWAAQIHKGIASNFSHKKQQQEPKQEPKKGGMVIKLTTDANTTIKCYDINNFNRLMKENNIVKVEVSHQA